MKAILPGSTVGVLGSGQLGRMFAIAARRMGYRVHTYSPENDTPTGQVADFEVTAPYHDLDHVREFARNVSVVTFEFENVPGEAAAAAAECAPVRPRARFCTSHRIEFGKRHISRRPECRLRRLHRSRRSKFTAGDYDATVVQPY